MKWIRWYIAANQRVVRWLSRRSGLYRIDVGIALREARALDGLAVSCERQGLADSAAKLREAAARNRAVAAEWSR